jgi:hypothetical protein
LPGCRVAGLPGYLVAERGTIVSRHGPATWQPGNPATNYRAT